MFHKVGQKIDQLTKKKAYPYVMAFFIPFVICVIICIGNGVYPFGDNCILHIDMYHQYCPFFTEFLNKLRTGGSLQYSWNLGLGSDFVSLYAYYLASPLNFLIVLCPKRFVIEFMTLLILVKIAASGLSFFWFLKYHFGMVGKDGRMHKLKVGYVPQSVNIEKNTPVSVYDLLASYESRYPVFLPKSRKVYEKIKESLRIFEAEDLIDKQVCNLSGGQLQRVLLSLAIMDEPNLLMLDEPVSGIDQNGM